MNAAFDNGLRKDYGNSEIRYDHFYYKKKKLSFTRQEFCNAHQLGAGKSFRICLAKDCIIGAGSLVTKNTVIPDGSLVMGSPARIKRNLTWEEKLGIMENSKEYVTVSLEMKETGCVIEKESPAEKTSNMLMENNSNDS